MTNNILLITDCLNFIFNYKSQNLNVLTYRYNYNMSKESYLHRYAKTVVYGWLKKKYTNDKQGWILSDLLPMDANPAKYELFMEYPIIHYKSKSYGLKNEYAVLNKNNDIFKGSGKIPTKRSITKFTKFEFLFDLAVIRDGNLYAVFEIMNTCPSSPEKIKFLKDNGIKCFEIDAGCIMKMCRPPKKIDCIQKF